MAVLPRRFYTRDAETVARALLGCVLERRAEASGGDRRRARITETEAYVGLRDLASHSSKGRTERNATMFGPPGHAYVYFVYGMHHCLNVVTGQRDGQAVLLRAAEPLDGWSVDLRGPGRLARAFGIDRSQDGLDLAARAPGLLRIHAGPAPSRIAAGPRIGVGYAGRWAKARLRFVAAASPYVSRPRP